MSLSKRTFGFPLDPFFRGMDDVFSSPFPTQPAVPFLTDINRDPDMILRRSSPCYEITENDEQFQLAIDVPGVKMSDISIDLEKDHAIHITGGRKVHKTEADGSVTSSQSKFEKAFMLNDNIDASKITASLEDGVLTVTVPKNVEKEVAIRKIPITGSSQHEGGNPQDFS